jgi:hypothetical protein
MSPLIQWASKIASVGGKYDLTQFQWFDATNAMQKQFDSNIPIDSLKEVSSPMPFHQMFICMDIKGHKLLMRIEENEEATGKLFCTVATIAQQPNGMPLQLGAFAIFKENGTAKITKLDQENTKEKDVQYGLSIIAMFQNSLRHHSVQVYQPTIKNTYTNQRLIKKGKPPLFEWKTVTIEQRNTESISLGGTHASPRLHDRRGHWRTMKKSGKRVWVRQCKVGDPSKGVVFHDYKFSSQHI